MTRIYSWIDQAIQHADKTLRVLAGNQSLTSTHRPMPQFSGDTAPLTTTEKRHVAGLMRINYAGEVCAQALYQGQAFTARNPTIKQQLAQAGLEEEDHLAWCQQRLQELNSHVSVLNPLWYVGSFTLGLIAGLAGDRWNLGFLAETERQVTQHLTDHLQKLPTHDEKTRVVLEQMRCEEQQHADTAHQQGAAELPLPIKYAMRFTAKIMTTTAYWV